MVLIFNFWEAIGVGMYFFFDLQKSKVKT